MTRLIDANEVAEQLGVCRLTVYRLTYAGKLPAVKVGRLVRFDPADVGRYIQSQKTEAGPPRRRRQRAARR